MLMEAVLQRAGLVFFYILLFLLDSAVLVGLPGGWIMLAAIFVFSWIKGFASIGWIWLSLMAAILVAGEIIESTLGVVVVAGKGATRWGVLGAFAGGIAGAVAGTAVIPVAGSMIFALLGAFAGAVVFEYLYYNSLDNALKTGFWAFMGKLWAMLAKFALGLAVLAIFVIRSWK